MQADSTESGERRKLCSLSCVAPTPLHSTAQRWGKGSHTPLENVHTAVNSSTVIILVY